MTLTTPLGDPLVEVARHNRGFDGFVACVAGEFNEFLADTVVDRPVFSDPCQAEVSHDRVAILEVLRFTEFRGVIVGSGLCEKFTIVCDPTQRKLRNG